MDEINLALINPTEKVEAANEIFKKTFASYHPSEVFLSFNGGKDCTVLLSLLKTYFSRNDTLLWTDLQIYYIKPEQPFDEMEIFVDQCEQTFDIKIQKVCAKLKVAIQKICSENSGFKAVIMGCRRSDPYCENLHSFQKCDPDWPPLVRINPLLEWTYKDIWDYTIKNHIIYCPLYDSGYTSIGDKTNTRRNPYLRVVTSDTELYKPAYQLSVNDFERAGRF